MSVTSRQVGSRWQLSPWQHVAVHSHRTRSRACASQRFFTITGEGNGDVLAAGGSLELALDGEGNTADGPTLCTDATFSDTTIEAVLTRQ
jgi:hypothetical protein